MSSERAAPLIEVENLTKHYPIKRGIFREEVGRVRAVDGISFEISPGETLGLVGESGCGKSTAATTLLRLEEPTAGEVRFEGEDITEYSDEELSRFRRRAQIVFQDPNSNFDPRMSIGESVAEPLRIQGLSSREHRQEIVEDLLVRVGMSAGDIDRYPHEFSGGQKQRLALARALTVNPDVIIADEPVSGLDESIQADILNLLQDLQDEFGLGILFISHDLQVVRDVADRLAVMYLGEIVEEGQTESVFSDPKHPYTRALLRSIPNPDPRQRDGQALLSGNVPDPSNPPPGCRFHTRCPEVIQPDGYEFDQEPWRSIMDFRVRLREREIDIESQREVVVAETSVEEPEHVSVGELDDALRSEFDLPDQLADQRAEDILDEAVQLAARGNIEAADDRLSMSFETICETEAPAESRSESGHRASCHLLVSLDRG